MGSGHSFCAPCSDSGQAQIRNKYGPLLERVVAQGKAGITRKHVTFATATIRYVEEIVKTGTHGSDVTAVIRSLVEQGVRHAIRDGLIDKRPNSD